MTALSVAAGLAPDKKLAKAVFKLAKNRNTRVRCAACFTIGTLQLVGSRKRLEKAVKSERGISEQFHRWAIGELGGKDYDGDIDPATEMDDWIPDVKLREGELVGI